MRTLIIYATKYGSTKKCTDILKGFLQGEITVARVNQDKIDLKQYDNIIIGGPVYMGKMNSHISSFCRRHERQLLTKRLALFACCYTPSEDTEYLKRLFPKQLLDHSVYTTTVGGIMDYDNMNVFHRKLFQSLKKIDGFNKEFKEPQIRSEDIQKIALAINA